MTCFSLLEKSLVTTHPGLKVGPNFPYDNGESAGENRKTDRFSKENSGGCRRVLEI